MLAFSVLIHNLFQTAVKVAVRVSCVRSWGLCTSLCLGVGVRDFVEHFGSGFFFPEEGQLPPTIAETRTDSLPLTAVAAADSQGPLSLKS